MKYYLKTCRKCGLISSSYHLEHNYCHRKCKQQTYVIDKEKIYECYQNISFYEIPQKEKTFAQTRYFWFCINWINQFPDINSVTTNQALRELNKMMSVIE